MYDLNRVLAGQYGLLQPPQNHPQLSGAGRLGGGLLGGYTPPQQPRPYMPQPMSGLPWGSTPQTPQQPARPVTPEQQTPGGSADAPGSVGAQGSANGGATAGPGANMGGIANTPGHGIAGVTGQTLGQVAAISPAAAAVLGIANAISHSVTAQSNPAISDDDANAAIAANVTLGQSQPGIENIGIADAPAPGDTASTSTSTDGIGDGAAYKPTGPQLQGQNTALAARILSARNPRWHTGRGLLSY